MSKEQTNKQFMETNEIFQAACAKAEVKPSKRQAGKFRRKCGKAFKMKGLQANENA